MENVINEVKEDIFSKIEPLIAFKKIEGINTYTFYFSLDEKFIIKYCCNLQKSRDYTFDISYETGKLDVETIEISSYTDNPKEVLPKIVKLIEKDNNAKNAGEPIFEKDNIDVMYTFYPSKRSFDNHLGITLKVELKPNISEDYPLNIKKSK